MVFVIVHVPWPISKGFGSLLFACLCLLASMLYAYVSLSSSRLCHVWRPPQAWPCVVTSDSHEALFRCNHLGGISEDRLLRAYPSPFRSAWCYTYHACSCHSLAFYASLHACLHVHAWVLFASVTSMLQQNEAMDIRSEPTFVSRRSHLLFAFLLVCLFACLLAFLLLYLPCLLVCCCRQPKIKPILLKIHVVVWVRIVPREYLA